MGCVLRVWGNNFDVQSFCSDTELEPIKVWVKGQPRFSTKPNGKINETSGLSLELSSADFSELDNQIDETILFCHSHHDFLARLVSFNGVDGAVADFGAEIYPPGWSSFSFSPELLLLLGDIGITLGLSVYPTDDESE